MDIKQRDLQGNKTDGRIDITRIKKIKAIKPASETRPHRLSIGARLACTALSALLATTQFYAKDADAKKKHKEPEPAAEVNPVDEWLAQGNPEEAAGKKAEEKELTENGTAAKKEQTEDEFLEGVYEMLTPPVDPGVPLEPEEKTPPKVEEEEKPVVTTNLRVGAPKRQTEYSDPALESYPDYTRPDGSDRGVANQDSGFDIGGNFIGNEAGVAGFMSVRYRSLARLDAGALAWNGFPMLPYTRLMLTPELEIWRIKLLYAGSVGLIKGMPSSLYTAHYAGIGYSQPIGDNFRFRMGGIIGGALSYPTWDATYFSMSAGLSMEFFKCFTVYGVPTFYFAANDPIKTAYVGYYEPRFQNLELGIQGVAQEYTARIFAEIGLIRDNEYGIYDRYGLKVTRSIRANSNMDVDIWGSLGMTQWSPQLSAGTQDTGRSDIAVMLGANLIIGGKYMNSTNTFRYSHLQDASWEYAETRIPDDDHPGPYAFGHSGDSYYDAPANKLKGDILNSDSFADLKGGYEANSFSNEEALAAASFLGATLNRAAYANKAMEDLTMGNPFSDEVKRVSSADKELIFQYLKGIVGWYENNGSDMPLPPQLSNGIALCSGIHVVMADFLSANGIDSVVATVETDKGKHVIAGAFTKENTVLLDYGDTYLTPPNTLDQAIRFYGQQKGARTLFSQFFAKNDASGEFEYIGTLETSEGRLVKETLLVDDKELIMRKLLGIGQ